MALYHGKGGMVTFGGNDIKHITSWTLNTSVDVADDTEMGDDWRSSLYGLIDFSVTVNTLNADAVDTVGTFLGVSAALGLELLNSDDIITGTAICTGLTESQPVDDVGTITLTFVGNDEDGLGYTGLT